MQPIQSNQPSATTSTVLVDVSTGVVDSGDVGAEVAELAVENGEAGRKEAHDQRSLEATDQERDDDAQVRALRNEASSMRSQGWFDATVGVASACIAVAFPASVGVATSTGELVGSHLADGAGKLGDGVFGAAEHDDEASAAAQKAAADRAQSAEKDADDAASEASANINTALDFARNYVSVEGQTQAAALHRA